MAKGFVDLGKELKNGPCCGSKAPMKATAASKVYYPSIFIAGVEDLDLSTGEITFTCKGRVVSVTDRQQDGEDSRYSCEIEVHSIKVDDSESGGLDKALDKIEKKKKY